MQKSTVYCVFVFVFVYLCIPERPRFYCSRKATQYPEVSVLAACSICTILCIVAVLYVGTLERPRKKLRGDKAIMKAES